jgi:UDP-N-acetylmuramyl pentapeptide phosphotransferase/UDP-N-acetylglucosamine-1-phosphate transferase
VVAISRKVAGGLSVANVRSAKSAGRSRIGIELRAGLRCPLDPTRSKVWPPGNSGGLFVTEKTVGVDISAAAMAFVLAMIFVRLLCSERLAALVLDVPNDRSLHARPVPRTGGVGAMLAAGITWLFVPGSPVAIAVPAILLAAMFLVDDIRGLPVSLRFAAQFAAGVTFLGWTGPYPILLWPVLALGIVWSVNLYNFMDGSNGLAGGMAVIGFSTYAVAAAASGAADIALLSAVVAGAAGGFLVWNLDPARIFLGDAGSIPLGFLAATIGVLGWQRGIWPFWFPALVFSLFIVDSGLTLAKRLVHRENPFQAHRSHYYQRLIRMGWTHGQLAAHAFAAMAATAGSALLLRGASLPVVLVVLAAWCVVIAAVAAAIDRRWRVSPVRGQ